MATIVSFYENALFPRLAVRLCAAKLEFQLAECAHALGRIDDDGLVEARRNFFSDVFAVALEYVQSQSDAIKKTKTVPFVRNEQGATGVLQKN